MLALSVPPAPAMSLGDPCAPQCPPCAPSPCDAPGGPCAPHPEVLTLLFPLPPDFGVGLAPFHAKLPPEMENSLYSQL